MDGSVASGQRADARRSRAAVLDAAICLLNEQPDCSMEAIATASGVTRQTVYAHFPSRDRLASAVLDHVTAEAVAAMDAAGPDQGTAIDALLRVLDASIAVAHEYPVLVQRIGIPSIGREGDEERQAPVVDRLRRVIERGQRDGEFGAELSADWLVTVVIALAHAGCGEVDAGRMSDQEMQTSLRTSLLRLLGAALGGPTVIDPRR